MANKIQNRVSTDSPSNEIPHTQYAEDSIIDMVISPSQRAFQMEYRYKQVSIFQPFLKVIDCGILSAMQTNYVSAWLTLLPVVEASIKEWGKIETINTESMKKIHQEIDKLSDSILVSIKNRKDLPEHFVESMYQMTVEAKKYIKYVLEILFMSFAEFLKRDFSHVFNRNLTLHLLSGMTDINGIMRSSICLILFIDMFAELFLMQDLNNWWNNCDFFQEIDNTNFHLRLLIYQKAFWSVFDSTENLLVNVFDIEQANEEAKQKSISKLRETCSNMLEKANCLIDGKILVL